MLCRTLPIAGHSRDAGMEHVGIQRSGIVEYVCNLAIPDYRKLRVNPSRYFGLPVSDVVFMHELCALEGAKGHLRDIVRSIAPYLPRGLER